MGALKLEARTTALVVQRTCPIHIRPARSDSGFGRMRKSVPSSPLLRYAVGMANKTLALSEALHRYLVEKSVREPAILQRLRAETAQDSMAMMQIGPEQGQFMQLLVRLMGAKNCLEVGVYTGYSSLAVALVLPADGCLVACDVSEKWT